MVVDDRPLQEIEPPPAPALPLADLAGLPAELREAEARRWIEAESLRPFDLNDGPPYRPLYRNVLLRLSGEDHVLLLRVHYKLTGMLKAVEHHAVLDVSAYPEISDLYLAADAMVTDYSSTMFDFAVTGKPLLFFTYDFDRYRDELRRREVRLEGGTHVEMRGAEPAHAQPLLRAPQPGVERLGRPGDQAVERSGNGQVGSAACRGGRRAQGPIR